MECQRSLSGHIISENWFLTVDLLLQELVPGHKNPNWGADHKSKTATARRRRWTNVGKLLQNGAVHSGLFPSANVGKRSSQGSRAFNPGNLADFLKAPISGTRSSSTDLSEFQSSIAYLAGEKPELTFGPDQCALQVSSEGNENFATLPGYLLLTGYRILFRESRSSNDNSTEIAFGNVTRIDLDGPDVVTIRFS